MCSMDVVHTGNMTQQNSKYQLVSYKEAICPARAEVWDRSFL